jgi:hypothetical protein
MKHVKRALVLLGTKPKLFLLEEQPPESFAIHDLRFVDLGYGDSPGFYDWLRVQWGQIIGVRFTPSEDVDPLNKFFDHLPYCQEVSEQLEIYFTHERKFDPKISADCYFSGNNLYVVNETMLAILFDIERRESTSGGLEDIEVQSLISLGANIILLK